MQFNKQQEPIIASAVNTRIVRLPAWFTVGQALRVADLRAVDHVLVEEQGQVRGFVDRTLLAAHKPTDPLARWAKRSHRVAAPSTSVTAALELMATEGVSCLPVASDGILVGTVTATALLELVEAPEQAAAA